MKNSELRNKITNIINKPHAIEKKLQEICDILRNTVPHYDWVGFYFRNGMKRELKLAQFSGKPTEHTLILFGKGKKHEVDRGVVLDRILKDQMNFVEQKIIEVQFFFFRMLTPILINDIVVLTPFRFSQ